MTTFHANDAHVHVWPEAVPRPDRLVTARSGGVERLLREMDDAGVAKAAIITPRAMEWDDSATLAMARAHSDRLVAVVRYDVTAPHAADTLAAAVEAGARGVRITTDDGPLAPFVDDDRFWALAADAALPIAVNAAPEALSTVEALVAAHPGVTVLFDHAGRPDVAAGLDDPHRQRVLGLSRYPNLMMKTPNAPYFSRVGAPFDDLDAVLDALLDHFGAERVLWSSDWPLCAEDVTYAASLSPIRRVLAARSDQEAHQVLTGNFEAVYGRG